MNMPEHEFIFLRHGQTEYNRERRFQGQRDVPLNKAGADQAEAAASILAGYSISRIIASPARRVQQTIEPFLQASQLPLHIEDDLMEYCVGSFEGRLHDDVRREFDLDEAASLWTVLPDDAESWPEFVSRTVSAVAHWTRQHVGETLLIASHGLVFRVLAETLTGEVIYSDNATPQIFRPTGRRWTVSPLAA